MPAYKNICPICLSELNQYRQYRGVGVGMCCRCGTEWSRVKTGGEMRVMWNIPSDTPGILQRKSISYKELKEKQENENGQIK